MLTVMERALRLTIAVLRVAVSSLMAGLVPAIRLIVAVHAKVREFSEVVTSA